MFWVCLLRISNLYAISKGSKQLEFIVVIEWNRAIPEFPWEMVLCFESVSSCSNPRKWTQFPLKQSDRHLLTINSEPAADDFMRHDYRACFTAIVPVNQEPKISRRPLISQHSHFAIKYRSDAAAPWLFTTPESGTRYGEILLQSTDSQKADSPTYLDLCAGWKYSKSQVEGHDDASVFILTSNAVFPRESSTETKKTLGSLVKQLRYLAFTNITEPWLAPRHGGAKFFISEAAVMSCFLNASGSHVTLLALNGVDEVVTTITSDEEDQIVIGVRNDSSRPIPCRVIAAEAPSLESSIAAAMSSARALALSMMGSTEDSDKPAFLHPKTGPSCTNVERSLDNWHDGLMYYTYNSLGVNLTVPKVLTGLDSLKSAEIEISTLIIDDNWQTLGLNEDPTASQLHRRSWERFEANKDFSPDGLKAAIYEVRQKHPYIKDFAVWHALLGYWGGISGTGDLAKKFKTAKVKAQLMGHVNKSIDIVHSNDAGRMYDDFYAFLASSGITSVKTDAQFLVGEIQESVERESLATSYDVAWTAAYLRHFRGKAISCMRMIPQILFQAFLQQDPKPRILLRNSDDYFPEIPTSHAWHLFLNAHNSLLTQHLNVVPDWDMFQTSHTYAAFHATARCLSGGPVSITDTPGEHNISLIHEITALTLDGSTIAIRPTTFGRTLNGYTRFSDNEILKIGAASGRQLHKTAFLGLFNLAEHETTFLVPVTDFANVASGFALQSKQQDVEIMVRSHREKHMFEPIAIGTSMQPGALVHAILGAHGCDIMSAHIVHSLSRWRSRGSFAILGLLGKMTGAAAVLSSSVVANVEDTGVVLRIELKALGVLGIWLSSEALVENMLSRVLLRGKRIDERWVKLVPLANHRGRLEIDVLAACKEEGCIARTSGSVIVDIFLNDMPNWQEGEVVDF